MSKWKDMLEKLATGDAIELQIMILFLGVVIAIVFVFFVGRALFQQKPEDEIRISRKPPKNWKNFCRTKLSGKPRK